MDKLMTYLMLTCANSYIKMSIICDSPRKFGYELTRKDRNNFNIKINRIIDKVDAESECDLLKEKLKELK